MAKQTKITRFNGGKVEDLRTQSSVSYSISKHFDIVTSEHRMVPYRGFEPDEDFTASSTTPAKAEVTRFLWADDGGTEKLFGLGRISDSNGRPKIYEKAAGGADLINGDWQDATNAEASGLSQNRRKEVFVEYKGNIYGFTDSGVYEYVISTNTFNQADQSDIGAVASTDTLAEPVHHPADDILYFFVNNVVHSLDNTTWSEAGGDLTLPSNQKIVSGAPYGNYLAIGTTQKVKYGKGSTIYFWNRNGALNTVSEKVVISDELVHLANLQGNLIAITYQADGTADADVARLRIRNATTGRIIKEFVGTAIEFGPTSSQGNTVVREDRLYFVMRFVDVNGEEQQGIWVVTSDGTLTIDQINEDASNSGGPIDYDGIYLTSNTWWVAHSNDGQIDRTSKTSSFLDTSAYESIIFTGGDSSIKKQLKGITVMTEPMPDDGQIVLKYRTDSDITDGNAFTTIKTFTGNNTIEQTATRPTNDTNFKKYREMQIRIESTGGAVVTGFKFIYDEFKQQYE